MHHETRANILHQADYGLMSCLKSPGRGLHMHALPHWNLGLVLALIGQTTVYY